MSEKQYFRKLLLTIQDKIRGLGSTNKNRWAAFCYTKTMTYDEFVDKLEKYNVQFQPSDIRVIWDSCDIQDPMDFRGFLKLMQTDVDDFVPVQSSRAPPSGGYGAGAGAGAGAGYGNDPYDAPPPQRDYYETPSYGQRQSPQYTAPARGGYDEPPARGGMMGGNCEDLIHENLRDIVIGCMSRDSLMTGEISRSGFADVCASYGIRESMPGFSSIISIGDAMGSGLVKYFTIAAHVCSSSPAPADNFGGRGGYGGSTYAGAGAYDDPLPRRGGYDAPPPEEPRRGGYEPQVQFDQQPPRKSAYQSSISFGDDGEPPRQFSRGSSGGSGGYGGGSGGYGGGFDDAPGCTRSSNDINDVLKNISVKVSENIGNSKAAFQKWRGFKDKLGAEEIRQGLIKDCQYNVPIQILQEICRKYGDPMSLTGFVRLMGDGTTIAEETPRKTSGGTRGRDLDRPMTEDDKAIENVALQLQGKDWEPIVQRCKTADDLCRAFAKIGVRVDENRIRVLVSKQGIRGFLDSIYDHLGN